MQTILFLPVLPLLNFVVALQLGNQLWPVESVVASDELQGLDGDGDDGGGDDIEKQIAKEVASMKRPRKETRFGMSSRSRTYDKADCMYS